MTAVEAMRWVWKDCPRCGKRVLSPKDGDMGPHHRMFMGFPVDCR